MAGKGIMEIRKKRRQGIPHNEYYVVFGKKRQMRNDRLYVCNL